MAPGKILCVAEKPAIAKAVAQHLSGGRVKTVSVRGNQYVKNYEFDFAFQQPWGPCSVTMTSVLGHITELDFDKRFKSWQGCPPGTLFECPVVESIAKDKKAIAENIKTQARNARALFIWTDCDREGEHIGSEVRQYAMEGNRYIEVKRAMFSNTEKSHVIQAARNPTNVDDRQVNAVSARIELDLRIGASFTRLLTLELQKLGSKLQERIISYGSCQFPTLGFVVDRYFRVKNFIAETFWLIKLKHEKDNKTVNFLWDRVHLFDRHIVIALYERCLAAKMAKVTKVTKKPTRKWRPLPLTTVDLQKGGSAILHIDSSTVMKIAESLYTKGFISYPRTETDQFDQGIDLKRIIQKQVQENCAWGPYAQSLLDGGFRQPRSGSHNDKAHPPIHPVNYVARTVLNADEQRVYEFVVRRFLACCSEDAKGEQTTVNISYGKEKFHANGLLVVERNYLDVYVYDKWESSQQLPEFREGETFEPTEAMMTDGKTVAPGYLTEPELISLMDANGIGTDATMAEHIAKIKARDYVSTRQRGSGGTSSRGRGRGRGRGGRATTGGRGGVQEFIPTLLGTALIIGYDNIGFEPSLSKPFLRKEMESKMKNICEGTRTKHDVVSETLEQYHEVFIKTQQKMNVLKDVCRKYVINEDV